MARASASPTPNPDAMKFTLDGPLGRRFDYRDASQAEGDPFAEAVFAAPGVAALFGTADFITVTRQSGADWAPIVAAVREAAERLL